MKIYTIQDDVGHRCLDPSFKPCPSNCRRAHHFSSLNERNRCAGAVEETSPGRLPKARRPLQVKCAQPFGLRQHFANRLLAEVGRLGLL